MTQIESSEYFDHHGNNTATPLVKRVAQETTQHSKQRRTAAEQHSRDMMTWLRAGAALLAVVAAAGALTKTGNGAAENERATENCVSAMVGRPVDLVQVAEGGTLQHPQAVLPEQRACERNNNNYYQAGQELGRTPDLKVLPHPSLALTK
jgi:hypothetical protein